MTKKIKKKSRKISRKNKELEYPYLDLSRNILEIKKSFNKLKKFKPKIISRNIKKKELLVIEENYKKDREFNYLYSRQIFSFIMQKSCLFKNLIIFFILIR